MKILKTLLSPVKKFSKGILAILTLKLLFVAALFIFDSCKKGDSIDGKQDDISNANRTLSEQKKDKIDAAYMPLDPSDLETCIDHYWVTYNTETGEIYSATFLYSDCYSTTANSAGGTTNENVITLTEEYPAPNGLSCKSFNFVSTTSNWQEAAVYDVRLNIVFYNTSTGNYSKKSIILGTSSRPLWFGLPMKRYDGTTYSTGKAAEIAAECVKYATDVVTQLYKSQPSIAESTLQSEFYKQIKNFMLNYAGKTDYYGSGSTKVEPKKAVYNFWGTGDCN